MCSHVLFWQVRVIIIQSPYPFVPIENIEYNEDDYIRTENFRSFLIDLFEPTRNLTYGLEICVNKKVEITFFTKAKNKLEAQEIGHTWLTFLKSNFEGLDGEIHLIPIDNGTLIKYDKFKILEINLPNGFLKYQINIIENFVKLFYLYKDLSIKLYLFWKRELKSNNEFSNLYNLRFFIVYNEDLYDDLDFSELIGILKFLCIKIETIKGTRAYLVKNSTLHKKLFEMNVFKDEEQYSTFTRDNINLDFPKILPLPRIPKLDLENVRYIDINEKYLKQALDIGLHIKDGIITNHKTYLLIDKLVQDLVIFGKSGSGKTYFLVQLVKQIAKKSPETGILILNVAKQSQEVYFQNFNILKYGDKGFSIPYFTEGASMEKSLLETASYICASLGLKNLFEKLIYYTETSFIKVKGKLPDDIIKLLKSVERYLGSNTYGKEVQSNLMQALKNRINVLNDDKLRNILKTNDNLPEWIIKWLNGENYFIDLSICNKYSKYLLVNALFQLIRSITSDFEKEKLKNLIVIDEAHAILEKPITNNSDDTDFIMKEQMAKIFSELLKEYRSRGVGFIIVDQSPSTLFDTISSQPSIKVIFRVDYPNNLLFSEELNERQMLTQLPNRLALVNNGTTGEKYLMKSLEFDLKKMNRA